jgi:activator of HSP90 ATPase
MEKFTIEDYIPAEPAAVYKAWLSGALHGAMTGAKATASAEEGGSFTAWDGYISGKNIELKKDTRIVQSWRTTEFASADPDSRLEITLKKTKAGTEITLDHSGIPDRQSKAYIKGWRDFYFKPMKKYFGKKT